MLFTCQIAQIKHFIFKIKHIKGLQNLKADAFSKKLPRLANLKDLEKKQDIDFFINIQLYFIKVLKDKKEGGQA